MHGELQVQRVDLTRLVVVGLAVALFSLSAFNAEPVWRPALSAMQRALAVILAIPAGHALMGVVASMSAFAFLASGGLLSATLKKQHPFVLAGVYAGYLVASGLAFVGVRVLADALEQRYDALMFGAPAGTSLLVAAAAAIFFTGIHELDDDSLPESELSSEVGSADSGFSDSN